MSAILSTRDTTPTHQLSTRLGTFAYRTFGRPDARPLVLFQRLRGTLDEWDPALVDELGRGRRVILFDNLGVSRTAGDSPKTVRGMAEAALAFLDALGEAEVDVLGWSLGGAVAQRLALEAPQRVRRLVLAATGPGGVPEAPRMPERVMQIVQKPVNSAEDFLYLFFPDTPEGRAAGRAHLARLRRWGADRGPAVKAETVRAQLAAVREWTMGHDAAKGELGRLAMPTLVANGTRDVMTSPYLAYVTAERAPHADLVLYAEAGHGFLFQHAQRFGREVLAFLG